jgi:hypothetical protein
MLKKIPIKINNIPLTTKKTYCLICTKAKPKAIQKKDQNDFLFHQTIGIAQAPSCKVHGGYNKI